MTRMEEIKNEKLELRKALDAPDCKLDEIQAKVEALESEELEIRKKAEIAEKLNAGVEIPGAKDIEVRKGDQKMENNVDKFDSMEYRKAFASYVVNGTKMPAEYRAAATTMTGDAGVAIPTTVVNRIIQKMENIDSVYNRVTHTAYATGVAIPVSTVIPTAQWVAEGKSTDQQKLGLGSVVFAGHKVRVAVGASIELTSGAIAAFENLLVESVSKALVKGMNAAIINGSGNGCPKGILTETPVETVPVSKLTLQTLFDMEAALPDGYDAGAVYFMSRKTFFALRSMKDGANMVTLDMGANGVQYSILGREVVFTPELPDFSAAAAGKTIAILCRPEDYVFNSNMQITLKSREDWDTEDQQTKAVAIADGKLVDTNGLVFVSKASA